MCCCQQPSINGQPNAYSWDGKTTSTYPPNPPAIKDGDELLYDLPGRCGGIDSHSHHLRLVKSAYGDHAILIRHGGGDERIRLHYRANIAAALQGLDDNTRYWLLLSVYYVHRDAGSAKSDEVNAIWRKAAAEKRIKTRKLPRSNNVKVWIEPEPRA